MLDRICYAFASVQGIILTVDWYLVRVAFIFTDQSCANAELPPSAEADQRCGQGASGGASTADLQSLSQRHQASPHAQHALRFCDVVLGVKAPWHVDSTCKSRGWLWLLVIQVI